MNAKQVVGLVTAFVTLGACMKSELIASRQVTPTMSEADFRESLTPSGSLWLVGVTAATAGAVYALRTRKTR